MASVVDLVQSDGDADDVLVVCGGADVGPHDRDIRIGSSALLAHV